MRFETSFSIIRIVGAWVSLARDGIDVSVVLMIGISNLKTCRCRRGDRQSKRKSRSLSHHALHRDLASLQLDQLARDRQAQPGSSEAARGASVGLAKCLKDIVQCCWRDADPRVMHRDTQYVVAFQDATAQRHPPFFGKFQGI